MRPPFHRFSDFSFQRWVALQANRDPSRVHEIFALFGEDGVNDWFAARHERNELAGYLANLETAWNLAETKALHEPPAAIGLELRYALIQATLRELVANFSPRLMTRLVIEGHMTRAQALTWGRQGTDQGSGFELLIEALRATGGAALAEEWLQAIETGGQIPDADNKVLSLVRRAGEVPAHLHGRLLALVEQEPNEGSREGALRTLVETDGLAETTLREAWRIACRMKREGLRADAMLSVAAKLGQDEQREALSAYANHISPALAGWTDDGTPDHHILRHTSIDQECDKLLSLSSELLAEWSSTCGDAGLRRLISAVLIVKQAEKEPLNAYDAVKSGHGSAIDFVWERLGQALIDSGQGEKAYDCILKVNQKASQGWQEVLVRAYAKLPAASSILFDELYRGVRSDWQAGILSRAQRQGTADPAVLRRLAALASVEGDTDLHLSEIAGHLTENEIAELLQRNLSTPSILGNIARYLTLPQVELALAANREDFRLRTQINLLLERLVTLGAYDAILSYVRENVATYELKVVMDHLTPQWPADLLPLLFTAIRPKAVLEKTFIVRGHLLTYLPVQRARTILDNAAGRDRPIERLILATELLKLDVPDDHFAAVLEMFLQAFHDCADAQYHSDQAVNEALRTIVQLPHERFTSELVTRIDDTLVEKEITPHRQFEWRSILCSGNHGTAGSRAAWEKTFSYYEQLDDIESFSKIANRSGAGREPLFAEMAATLDDEPRLMFFTIALGSMVDEETADAISERILTLEDSYDRYHAYVELFPRMSSGQQARIAAVEAPRLAAESNDRNRVHWLILLDSMAPGTIASHGLRERFLALEPVQQVMAVAMRVRHKRVRDWFVETALEQLESVPRPHVPGLLCALAPVLTEKELVGLVDRVEREDEIAESSLAVLARYALSRKYDDLAAACLTSHEVNLPRQNLVKTLADDLSARILNWCAVVARSERDRPTFRPDSFDTESYQLLAHRAATLGEIELVRHFLELKGANWDSNSCSIEDVFAALPQSEFEAALEIASALDRHEKTSALCSVFNRWPDRVLRSQLDELLQALLQRKSFNLMEVGRLLGPALALQPDAELLDMFANAMRRAARIEREAVLGMVRIFMPTLLHRFGADVAVALDDACKIGCRPTWP